MSYLIINPNLSGGRILLKFYLNRWKGITSDSFVLNSVLSNYVFEFDYEPTPTKHNFTPEYKFLVPKISTRSSVGSGSMLIRSLFVF